jgi:hypothetical protein
MATEVFSSSPLNSATEVSTDPMGELLSVLHPNPLPLRASHAVSS